MGKKIISKKILKKDEKYTVKIPKYKPTKERSIFFDEEYEKEKNNFFKSRRGER